MRTVDQDEKHPILAGLVALVAVAVSVGVVLGIVALVGTHILGVGGEDASGASNADASLYLPSPSPTETPRGPALTLSAAPSETGAPTATAPPTRIKRPKKVITLQASTVRAAPMALFTLSGVYPGGEGALLRLQRQMPGGGWQDFGIPDVAVSGGQYSTQVQTGRPGVQKFRMKNVDSGRVSNVVRVRIG
jgi:hypothetical protein